MVPLGALGSSRATHWLYRFLLWKRSGNVLGNLEPLLEGFEDVLRFALETQQAARTRLRVRFAGRRPSLIQRRQMPITRDV